MGHQELLLTIGAIVTFSILNFTVSQHAVRNSDAIYSTQAEFYATSLAQRFIEEAKTKAFDKNTLTATADAVSDFTPSLGPEAGEVYPNFNDVDDYDGLTRNESFTIDTMRVTITVFYVDETNLNTDAGTRKFYKKMRVSVQSSYLISPVRTDYVFAFQRNP